jgi:hypothetical protein
MNHTQSDPTAENQLFLEQIRPDDLFYIKAYFSRIGQSLPEEAVELDSLMLNSRLQSFCLGFYEALRNKLGDDPKKIMSPVANEEGSLSDYNLGVLEGLKHKRSQREN